jgi:prepilin-type N-terminal cleavage/methylation domain-containing protein
MISRKNGFTLVEILVSLTVFAVVMAVMGSAFYKISQDWQRQRDYNLVLENGRWAMEFMSDKIRTAHASNDVNHTGEAPLNDHELLRFLFSPGGHGNPHDKQIYFWRGQTGLGQDYVLYYSRVDSGDDINDAAAVAVRKELCRFVVPGTEIFNVSAGCAANPTNCTVEINLTVRPKPDQPIGPGNQNYIFRTLVRPRN